MQALLIVDVQNDFMPGGSLPTPKGNEVIEVINRLIEKAPLTLATKDWHPKDHVSFVTNHPGRKVGEVISSPSGEQILWPVHCVQESVGAEFASGLNVEGIDHIFYKGTDPIVDSYSAFFDNAHIRKTGLEDFLKNHHIEDIAVVGVATDYCVLYSVLDALELGFTVSLVKDGCRSIDQKPGDGARALEKMQKKGAAIVQSNEV